MKLCVVIFGYNRSGKLDLVFSALEKNVDFKLFDYVIYLDGAKCDEEKNGVEKTYKIAKKFSEKHTSVKVIINKRSGNFGLKNNIESGLKDVSKKYEGFVVLEDDIVPNEYFLSFHKTCLTKYRFDRSIMHINGWSYPQLKKGKYDITFVHMMSCWGWSTWPDRWCYYQNDSKIIRNLTFFDKVKFNRFFSCLFYSHLYGNYTGEVSTWAVFWMLTIFNRGGLCVTPRQSMVQNFGIEELGTHREIVFRFQPPTNFNPKVFPPKIKKNYPNELKINVYHFMNTPKVSLFAAFLKLFKKLN